MDLFEAASLFLATPAVVLVWLGATKLAGRGFISGPRWLGLVVVAAGIVGLALALVA